MGDEAAGVGDASYSGKGPGPGTSPAGEISAKHSGSTMAAPASLDGSEYCVGDDQDGSQLFRGHIH